MKGKARVDEVVRSIGVRRREGRKDEGDGGGRREDEMANGRGGGVEEDCSRFTYFLWAGAGGEDAYSEQEGEEAVEEREEQGSGVGTEAKEVVRTMEGKRGNR